MPEENNYSQIESVLFSAALGENATSVKSETLIKKTEDGQATQVRTKNEPNIPLALKLLDQRIGGPQDWC